MKRIVTLLGGHLFGLLLMAAVALSACVSEKQPEVQRVSDVKYSTVTDSIYTMMPGRLLARRGYVYWQDVKATEKVIHVVDAVSGKETGSFGTIGEGPDDFTMPLPSVSPDGFYLDDLQKGISHLYTVGKEGIQVEKGQVAADGEVTQLVHVDKHTTVTLTPGKDQPFQVTVHGRTEPGGQFPVAEKYSNSFYLHQGNIAFNSDHKLLVYSSLTFPYLATYSLKKGRLSLQRELSEEVSYTVQDGQLVMDKGSRRGAMELGLTKHHIVTLDRDVVTEGERPQGASPRDPSTLPRSLFIHDYGLHLTHILTLPFPVLRICGDVESDQVYAIVLNPEYSLIKVDVSSL